MDRIIRHDTRLCPSAIPVIVLVGFLAVGGAQAAEDGPLPDRLFNTNPLAQRGISPEVLDAIVSLPSQGPAFTMVVELTETVAGGTPRVSERVVLESDPFTSYGLDIRIVRDGSVASGRSDRDWKHDLERMIGTAFTVRGQQRMYDPESIRVVSESGERTVVAFAYDRMRVPYPLRHLAKLEGRVVIDGDRLDRIELRGDRVDTRGMTRVDEYNQVMSFARVRGDSGWLVDEVEIVIRGRRGGKEVELALSGRVVEYRDLAGEPVDLERTAPPPARPEFAEPRTVQLRLSRALPLWGDRVRQLGFELPKPYGIGVVTHFQRQDMSIDGVTVNNLDVGGGDVAFIDPQGSGTSNSAQALSVRADVWVLPFLDLDLVAGEVETDSDVTLRFTPQFRSLVRVLTGAELREFETLPVTTTSTMLGVGLSTGFQYESLFGALSAQWATSVVNETGSELDILVATFLVGYDFGDIGLRLQTGAQYQDWDQAIRGEIALGGGRDPLEFDIDLSVDKTTFLVGLYKDFGRTWNATLLAGFGARDQLTMTLGYRF
ncbi:MAG: hypothetical protein PVG53_04540 [Holophagae bacterium]|jgi:hypothetical protein